MKKIILSLVALVAAVSANAQISNDKGTFSKPVAGNLLIELQATPDISGGGSQFQLNDPFLANLSGGLSKTSVASAQTAAGVTAQSFTSLTTISPMLKGRYFLSDNSALRVQIGVSSSSSQTQNSAGSSTVKQSINQTAFGLIVGYEKHFAGAERLSTYVGADLMFGIAGAKSKVSGGAVDTKGSQTGLGIGVRAVTGFDYYVLPKVYLGAELGLGISYSSYGVVKASGGTNTDGKVKSHSFDITPMMIPAIRLGYNF